MSYECQTDGWLNKNFSVLYGPGTVVGTEEGIKVYNLELSSSGLKI